MEAEETRCLITAVGMQMRENRSWDIRWSRNITNM